MSFTWMGVRWGDLVEEEDNNFEAYIRFAGDREVKTSKAYPISPQAHNRLVRELSCVNSKLQPAWGFC